VNFEKSTFFLEFHENAKGRLESYLNWEMGEFWNFDIFSRKFIKTQEKLEYHNRLGKRINFECSIFS
jgi:hypothetical protein